MVIYNVHGQVIGIFAWQAPLNTLTGYSRKNQHLKVLIWGGGRGGLGISTLCTNRKMLTIVNGPLHSSTNDYLDCIYITLTRTSREFILVLIGHGSIARVTTISGMQALCTVSSQTD